MQIERFAALLLTLCFYNIYAAENSVVVTGSRNGQIDSVSASSTVTAKEIEEKQSVTVGDAVREMPGIYVSGDGRTGQAQFVFVRGFRSSDVLILIDGVELRNPLSPDGATDLSLSPENIAKIELLKGPQPVLYGSGALAGVLNIQTKKGFGKPSFSTSFSTGVLDMSNERYIPDTFNVNISSMGGNCKAYYNGGASFFYTEGISMADSYSGVKEGLYDKTPENDKVIKGSGYFRTGVTIDNDNEWDLIFRVAKGKNEIDDGPGIGQDDPDRYLDSEDFLMKSGLVSSFFDKKWTMTTDFSIFYGTLFDSDSAEHGKVTGDLDSSYSAVSGVLNWENAIIPAKGYELTLGIELKKEWGKADYTDYSAGRKLDLSFTPSTDLSTGIYAFNVFKPVKGLEINGGIRAQANFYQIALLDEKTDNPLPAEKRKSIEPLFSAGTSYEAPSQTVFKARIGRGTKTPTLFQRFSRYADLYNELKPETALGFDGIVQQYFYKRKILVEAGYFYELKSDHISLDKSGKYSNRYMVENHGIEISLLTKPLYGLSLKAAYTWIFKMKEYKVVEYFGEKYREETDLLRRPAHTFDAVLNYNLMKKLNISLCINYVGERLDEVYNYPKTPYIVTVDDFVILNLAISYKINKYLTIYGKIENMLDNDDYAYSVEYGTAGITPWLGLKFDAGG
ncbi:MAG TPA: TonB-dependent receptor [bacterium]|nr:TonB-dependent receptor [bacterium]HQN72707.1 TonB-dependent receptor [bacterium]HQO92091.1 TonB-dependent receptor [bacterium]